MNSLPQAHVIIATKGRAALLPGLLDRLQAQTQKPASVVFVGADEADLPVDRRPGPGVRWVVAKRAGLCIQRNVGIEAVLTGGGVQTERDFIVFFDDDFLPRADWLKTCAQAFRSVPDLVGVTGTVLADGAHGAAVSIEEADGYLAGTLAPRPHWASGPQPRPIDCLYGCNMAFRIDVIRANRFDEALPLYGWQEDQDYSSRARAFGSLMLRTELAGVHLGVKGGRTSGRRLGYSQFANPWYLCRKGTMSWRKFGRFMVRHLASNHLRGLRQHAEIDYRGRAVGNWLAFIDLVRGRLHPMRAVDIR